MRFDPVRALTVYAGITTAALAAFLLSAATRSPDARFAQIDVERINVREPDGTLRMTVSSAARSPGIIVRGHEYPHPSRKEAGLLFFNDEGTENGGLIFGGSKAQGGTSFGSLTFDRYEQDQVVQLIGEEDGAKRRAGLAVFDRPEGRMDFPRMAAAQQLPEGERMAAYAKANIGGGVQRVFVGRLPDASSRVALKDAAGKERLVLRVSDTGAAAIDFLDAGGKVVRTMAP